MTTPTLGYDTTLIVALSHNGREIERNVASSSDAAAAAAIRLLCKRGDDLRRAAGGAEVSGTARYRGKALVEGLALFV